LAPRNGLVACRRHPRRKKGGDYQRMVLLRAENMPTGACVPKRVKPLDDHAFFVDTDNIGGLWRSGPAENAKSLGITEQGRRERGAGDAAFEG